MKRKEKRREWKKGRNELCLIREELSDRVTSLLRHQPYCIFLCSACLSSCQQINCLPRKEMFSVLFADSRRNQVFAQFPSLVSFTTGQQGCGQGPPSDTDNVNSGLWWVGSGQTQGWPKTKENVTHHVYFWDGVDTGYVDAHPYDDWRTWRSKGTRKMKQRTNLDMLIFFF